jgi:hypothetical protein
MAKNIITNMLASDFLIVKFLLYRNNANNDNIIILPPANPKNIIGIKINKENVRMAVFLEILKNGSLNSKRSSGAMNIKVGEK